MAAEEECGQTGTADGDRGAEAEDAASAAAAAAAAAVGVNGMEMDDDYDDRDSILQPQNEGMDARNELVALVNDLTDNIPEMRANDHGNPVQPRWTPRW